jgi:hypothetical protein
MRKKAHKVQVSRRQIDSAIERAGQFEAYDPRVAKVQYEEKEDLVSLYFADGLKVSIPRKQLQGLEEANQSQLSKIEIVGDGTGLHWPLLDVDHYVLGLLEHRFGTKRSVRDETVDERNRAQGWIGKERGQEQSCQKEWSKGWKAKNQCPSKLQEIRNHAFLSVIASEAMNDIPLLNVSELNVSLWAGPESRR